MQGYPSPPTSSQALSIMAHPMHTMHTALADTVKPTPRRREVQAAKQAFF